MKTRWLGAMLLVGASVAGAICGQLLGSSILLRNALGQFFGRGELIAVVHGSGIYQADLTGRLPPEMEKTRLIAEAAIAFQSRDEKIATDLVNRQYDLLASQLRNEKKWTEALRANRLCPWIFHRHIARNLRSEQWIENQLSKQTGPGPAECRTYFDENRKAFGLPQRFRAAHLFLAAPADTPDDIVGVKRRTIEQLLTRLDDGEKFSDLVAAFSEDEATKEKGGDLGYFFDLRMPGDFMSIIHSLHAGETSRVVQTELGFHIIQLTDSKSAREMVLEEALPEIQHRIDTARRRIALDRIISGAAQEAEFRR